MKRSIYEMAAIKIAKNAIRRTNWEGSSDCREFYFNDYEVAEYIEDTFYERDILDIYRRLEEGEFVLIKELCNEYLNSSFNNCGSYFELYITIGEGEEQSTYLLYSQYDKDYADKCYYFGRYCKHED